MDVSELLDIALAGAPPERVEVATLESAEVAMEAVSGLAQLIAELVDNAVAFSDPGQPVRVSGFFSRDDYLITISDHGVGIPESLLVALNRVLEDPRASDDPIASMGILQVARLASRLGVAVRLVPAMPGTTARVTIPARLVGSGDREASPATREPGIFEEAPESGSPEGVPVPMVTRSRAFARFRHQITMGDAARGDAEAFLDRVFGPLVGKPRTAERPGRRPELGNDNGPLRQPPRPDRAEGPAPAPRLRVRVPGTNFTLVEDQPSTVAAEGAIDIRSALSRYQEGRRSAAEQTPS